MTETKLFEFAEFATNAQSDIREAHGQDTRRSELFSPFGTKSEKELRHTDDDLKQAVEMAQRETAIEVEASIRQIMADDIQQRQLEVLNAIRDQLANRGEAFDRELKEISHASQQLALALAKSIIPRAIGQQPLADVAKHLQDALLQLNTPLSIDVRLAPELSDSAQAIFSDLAEKARFRGQIGTLPDSGLALGDAMIEWKGGAVERRLDRIQAEAWRIAEQWLPVEPPDCMSPELEVPMTGSATETEDITPTNEQVKP